jgi:hypothetical protein
MHYANWNGHLKLADLRRNFAARYPADWLARVGCEVPESGETWIERIIRKPDRIQNPIRYLLMANFAGVSLSELIDLQAPPPFGAAPWPCLNVAAAHYSELRVRACTISPAANGRVLTGTFTCPDCGMTYERIGPDRKDSDRMYRVRIPCYGPVWDETLLRLWPDRSVSLRELSRRLGVDPNTVKLQAGRLGLSIERLDDPDDRDTASSQASTPENFEPKRDVDQCKYLWKKLADELPGATRTGMRRLLPAVYASLRRHAAVWLKNNSPEPLPNTSEKTRIDWEARDSIFAKKAQVAAENLMSRVPPVKLTPTAILREAQCIWAIPRKLPLLPMTLEALARLAEDRVSFAVRRIHAVAEAEGAALPRWQLERKAGLRPDLIRNPEIQLALAMASRKRLAGSEPVARQRASAACA